jgi:general secretion pathway protein M
MRVWWDGLQDRERLVLIAGGFVAALIVLWAAVWNPLFVNTARLSDDISTKERLLAEVTRLEAAGVGSSAPARPAAAGSLVVVVDQTIRSQGLSDTLKRNQPNGTDGINLTFQSASFDTLIRWLAQLNRDHGISVQSASFSETRQPGLVNSTLVLSRG